MFEAPDAAERKMKILQKPIKKGDKMEFFEEKERICVRDESGTVVAEVVFSDEGEDSVCITRTYVEEGLRGQGIAAKLMEAAVNSARRRGKKIIPQCSYAAAWLAKHPQDITERHK
ncbi:MAG: GNAT family N-acetyltransferase [Christensenellaceae bacterium]